MTEPKKHSVSVRGLSSRVSSHYSVLWLLAATFFALMGLSCNVSAAESLPPFTAEARIVSKIFNPLSNSYTETQSSAVFQSSNTWWHFRVTPLNGPTKGLPFDCRTIEGGIRHFADFGLTNGVLSVATACPIEYPPPGRSEMLALWLTLCPNLKLPLIDTKRMRRFLAVPTCQQELINDPRNQGTFGLKLLAPGQSFVSELNITNNGISLQFMGYVGSYPPPFDKGFTQLKYALHEVTNVGAFTFPLRATCQRFGPDPAAKTPEDLIAWNIDEVRIVQIKFSGSNDQMEQTSSPRLFADDYRPKNLPTNKPVGYLVANDSWKSPTDPEIASRANKVRQAAQLPPRSTQTDWARLVLAIIALTPILLLFVWKKRKQKHQS